MSKQTVLESEESQNSNEHAQKRQKKSRNDEREFDEKQNVRNKGNVKERL